jgi:hypothetical protein
MIAIGGSSRAPSEGPIRCRGLILGPSQ